MEKKEPSQFFSIFQTLIIFKVHTSVPFFSSQILFLFKVNLVLIMRHLLDICFSFLIGRNEYTIQEVYSRQRYWG